MAEVWLMSEAAVEGGPVESRATAAPATARREPTDGLAELVRAFVERNVPFEWTPTRVHLSQEGEMQLKPGRWLRFTAEQETASDRVQFAWRARFPIASRLALGVNDWYAADAGALEVRLLGLPLRRVRGHDVARGEAMRYLAELPWVPHAALFNRELVWHDVDDRSVEVATNVDGERVAVRLHFDDRGDIVAVAAPDRPRAVGRGVVPTPFSGGFTDYQHVGAVRLPTTAEVRWELPDGPFVYFRGRVTSYAAH